MKFEDIKFPDVKKVAVSLSGGLDSTTLVYILAKKYGAENVYALSYFYQQKQCIELEMAKATCIKLGVNHKVVDISFLGDIVGKVSANIQGSDIEMPTIQDIFGVPQPVTYVPFRNMIFSSILMSFAESNDCGAIALGLQAQDLYSYWDCSEVFTGLLQDICNQNRIHQIQIFTPFTTMSKVDEIEIGTEIGVDYALTLTCYNPDEHGVACGKCPSCAERIQAFIENDLIDPAKYNINIKWGKYS